LFQEVFGQKNLANYVKISRWNDVYGASLEARMQLVTSSITIPQNYRPKNIACMRVKKNDGKIIRLELTVNNKLQTTISTRNFQKYGHAIQIQRQFFKHSLSANQLISGKQF